MGDDWEVVFYLDEDFGTVSSITPFHQENCSVGDLVEAHPDIIYFYAHLVPA